MFFFDKAMVSGNERLSIEAVMMQLGIHKRAVRFTQNSFRNLGVIPRLAKLPYGSSDALKKLKDYHVLLDAIFEEIGEVMFSNKPLLWIPQFNGHITKVQLRPYVHSMIGDTPGHNQLLGKQNAPPTVYKCRYCHCPKHKLHDPTKPFPRLMHEDYSKDFVEEDDMKENCSMYLIDNALDKLEYGVCKHGPAGLCLGEVVHVVQIGYLGRNIEGTVAAPITSKYQLKKEKDRYKKESWTDGRTMSIITSTA
jgi:hypothetical protein